MQEAATPAYTAQEMKGLVLAAGSGTRLRPFTYSQPKHLLSVGGRAIIEYGLAAIAVAGIREVGVVVGPETDRPLREHLGDGSQYGLHISFVYQSAPKGLAHAVLCAEQYLEEQAFLMFLGDNLMQDSLVGIVERFAQAQEGAVIALKDVPNPSDYGVAELDSTGRVVRLLEKPARPPSNLAVVGAYAFSPQIVDACRKTRPSARGELEIVDAIQLFIEAGRPVLAHRLEGWWKDTGKPEHLLEANDCVLDTVERDVRGQVVESEIVGPVVLAEDARVYRSTVRGPALIGPKVSVECSRLGPYVSLGRGVRISDSSVERSIVMDGAQLKGMSHLMESIVGRHVVASARNTEGRSTLILGDEARVRLG